MCDLFYFRSHTHTEHVICLATIRHACVVYGMWSMVYKYSISSFMFCIVNVLLMFEDEYDTE